MTRVYLANDISTTAPIEVGGSEAHHLLHVVRTRVGDAVRVFDGRGGEWDAHVVALGRSTVLLGVDGTAAPVREPPVRVTLGVGLLKGDQMDAVMRDATVMGAAAVVPLITDHVVVPARMWKDEGARDRWRRVTIAAAKQCGRAVVPEIGSVTRLADLLTSPPAQVCLVCREPALPAVDAPRHWRDQEPPASALLLVGPEGGWSSDEARLFEDYPCQPLSLGPRTLRAESVPAVALAMIWTSWGW